jgi:hypothetical protein
VVGLLLLSGAWSAGCAAAAGDRTPPTVSFSADEHTVRVRHRGKEWVIPRPVVSAWDEKVAGHTYWVSPHGDDRGRGTKSAPFRTLRAGLAWAEAGDRINVLPGTYREYLIIEKSGQRGRPIILSCAPGALGKVKLEPPTSTDEKGRLLAGITLTRGAHDLWINGLVIEGARGLPRAAKVNEVMVGTNGISWAGKAGDGCRATNNVVYWHVHCGLKEVGHGGTGILMEGNVVFDNGSTGFDHGIYVPADDVTVHGNVVFANASYGIHSYSHPTRQVITRNVCFDNAQGGIILAASQSKVYFNTCVNNGRGLLLYAGACHDNDIRDNIFAFNKEDCVFGDGGAKLGAPHDNTDDFNDYFPGAVSPRIPPGRHDRHVNPRFRDARKGDFRLAPASPCAGVATKVDGETRKEKRNLGAY